MATCISWETCVAQGPSGEEKGVFYAVDFGGTNLRAVRCELDGNRGVKTDQFAYTLTPSRRRRTIPAASVTPRRLRLSCSNKIAGRGQGFDGEAR